MAWSAKDLERMFGNANLTAIAVRTRFTDVPFIARVPKRNVDSTIFKYDVVEVNREIDSTFTATDGSSTGVQRQTYGVVAGEMPVTFKNVMMPPELLRKLRNPGTEETRDLEAWSTREIVNLRQRFGDYLDAYLLSQMFTGTLSITVNGVARSIDYQIPSTHKPAAGAAWSTAGTAIKEHVTTFKRLISDDTGYQARELSCNQGVMNDVMGNTEIQNYIKETDQAKTLVSEGIITNLYQLVWRVVDGSYLSSGTATRWIADDRVLLTPDWNAEWLEMLIGDVAILDDSGNETIARGMNVWSRPSEDPVGRKIYFKYARIPKLGVPKAIVYADVSQ